MKACLMRTALCWMNPLTSRLNIISKTTPNCCSVGMTFWPKKVLKKVTISDAELSAFRAQAADPIRAAWIADMEAQGIPGQELFDLVMTTLENTRKGN